MSEVFALKTGTFRSVLDLIEPLLEVRFRKVLITELDIPWYVAISKDEREYLALFPNENKMGDPIDIAMQGYELFLYLVRSPREDQMTRLIARETRFRYVRPPDRVVEFANRRLDLPAE